MQMNREAEGGSVAFFNKEKKPENGTAMCAIHESVEFILNSRINRQPVANGAGNLPDRLPG